MAQSAQQPVSWMQWLFPRRFGPREVPGGLGKWGRYTFLEPHVRRLAAQHLGVGSDRLDCGASLRGTLDANPGDLRRLATALEREFGIVMPADVIDGVGSYGDLVHTTGTLVYGRHATA